MNAATLHSTPTSPPSRLTREQRLALPVSGKEVALRDGESIVSMTDIRGVITYINEYFIEVSGYTEAELIGQPHNLIRHPHMPAAAFADLWANLKQGRPWVGMVQNRCKNGDHYWVQANVTPVLDERGEVTGYMSVRKKPSREQVDEAERSYAALREGRLRDPLIRNGRLLSRRWWQRLDPFARLGLPARQLLLSGFSLGLGALLLGLSAAGVPLAQLWALWLFGAAIAGLAGWRLLADLLQRSREAAHALRAIARNDFNGDIDISRSDELGRVLQGLKSMQIRLGFQLEQVRREAASARRINEALDVAAANVMVADADLRIVFANRAVSDTFREGEAELASVIPGFRADQLVGSSIDRFHAQPQHQRELLRSMTRPHAARIELGALTFDLRITPVLDERGRAIGYVVEWRDRTRELQMEREIEVVVEAASHGQVDRRIGEDGKSGHALSVARGINQVLQRVQEAVGSIQLVLRALAEGDLTRRVEQRFEGAFGAMAADANHTVERLGGIVGRIQSAVAVIDTAAGEIAAGNNDLAGRTETQAASLEETASSMEQLTATVRENADSARSARGLSAHAVQIAQRGGAVVEQAMQTMDTVSNSSRRIEDIIAVIDGIAFQTNILALNAAVEAARAGEQGRGFAVVASEVRALAQRSATSAKEIKQLIGASTEAVKRGAQEVGQAGAAIRELLAEADKVSALVAAISAATDEQAAGLRLVNETVTQLDAATQQNAALVEQASAAATSMEQQADELARAVAVFRVGEPRLAPVSATLRRAG